MGKSSKKSSSQRRGRSSTEIVALLLGGEAVPNLQMRELQNLIDRHPDAGFLLRISDGIFVLESPYVIRRPRD